jgi:hypothetical protein
MEPIEQPTLPPFNKHSIVSLILAILTILSFCTGWSPIPFTGFICFPTSVLLGITALAFGFVSLNRIRKHNHRGHSMAWTGIVIGGFVVLCILCMVAAMVAAIYYMPSGTLPLPPFLKDFHA